MKFYIFLCVAFSISLSFAQDAEPTFTQKDISVSQWIDGTLLVPKNIEKPKLAIIIAGSGPTNRDGNQNFSKNNSLKKLAEGLTSNGIATFRYDKRIVKQIRQRKIDNNMMFDDFVTDAKDVIQFFKAKNEFSKIYVIGHSQGSLVGMLAGQNDMDGFVSLAGPAQNIGDVLVEQITKMDSILGKDTKRIVETLKTGKTTDDFPLRLASVFGKHIQPFMMNWMKYSPLEEIKSINQPILIVNGTKDLQVPVEEAQLLKAANENAQLQLIEHMNHVLFKITGDDIENSKSYNESFRPIMPELIKVITDFIK